MRIIFGADWQADITNLDRLRITVDQTMKLLQVQRPSYFVHLGDLKERMNPVDQRVTNFLIESFERIKSACDGFFVVRGNHDSITTQDNVPSCMTMMKSLGAGVADEDWKWFRIGGCFLYMVPFFREQERQKNAFAFAYAHTKTQPKILPRILAFHNEVSGCMRSANSKGEGLTAKDIGSDAYNICIGGHIHLPQRFGNIIYAGSPFAMDWSEANQEHRLLVLNVGD